MAANNWSLTRNMRPSDGDRGLSERSQPFSTHIGADQDALFISGSALRNGVNSNFVPAMRPSANTDSTSAGNTSYTTTRTSDGMMPGFDGPFDNELISRRPPPGRQAPTMAPYTKGNMGTDNRQGYQVPQRGGDFNSKRGSFSSDATFATQAFSPQIPARQNQNFPSQDYGFRNAYNPPRGHMNGTQQTRNGDFGALGHGMNNMRIAGPLMTGPQHGIGNFEDFDSRGRSNDNNHDFDTAYSGRSRNDSHPGAQEGRSREYALLIKNGMCEDPYDHSLKRLTEPPKQTNPTLGPARFKDSKVFATVGGDDEDPNAAPSIAVQPQMDIIPGEKKTRPDWIDLALQGLMVPSLEEAFDALPLGELCRTQKGNLAGVVRIKDIPYGTTRQEMTAFIGRNAQILRQPEGSPYHAVHILMERESGKTMDCFIEVTSPTEAAWVARQFGRRVEQKRPPKVGDRQVQVLYSSQDELMVELFPRAKHVRWSNGEPVVDKSERKYYEDKPAAGFQGFLHPEELVAMAKHANLSERSPFANKSPCRVYESIITLLYKYPWKALKEITVRERRAIFDCAIGLMKTLITDLRRANNKYSTLLPTPALLQELSVAALSCPGFTEKQKASIVSLLVQGGYKSMADGRTCNVKLGGNDEYSPMWPFSALNIVPDADPDVVRYFARIFRNATANSSKMSLASRKADQMSGQQQGPMGNWNIDYGKDASNLSLAAIGKKEFDAIEEVLVVACSQSPQRHHNDHSAPDSRSGSSSSQRSFF